MCDILGTVVPKSTIFRRPILQKYITNPITLVTLWEMLLFPQIAKGGSINGFVYDAWNGQTFDFTDVSVIINNGFLGTETCKIPYFDIYGCWAVDSGNFSPWPSGGDTIKMSAEKIDNEEYTHSKLKYQSPNYFYRTYCEKQDDYFYQPALTN